MKETRRNTLMKFGENVSRIRMKKGLSLRQLELKCEIGYASLCRIENGKLDIRLTSLIELARGLGVNPGKLLDSEIKNN